MACRLYRCYKQLKKHLKLLPEKQALEGMNPIPEADALALTENESAFVRTLNADVQLFNETYLEREEDSIIRLRSLEDEGDDAQSPSDLESVYRYPTPPYPAIAESLSSDHTASTPMLVQVRLLPQHWQYTTTTRHQMPLHPEQPQSREGIHKLQTPHALASLHHSYQSAPQYNPPQPSVPALKPPPSRSPLPSRDRIQCKVDAVPRALVSNSVAAPHRRFVDFHGEMLLLVHWSILAYTGLVKILKKHHKRTGLLVRAPHLDNLLSQPFCSVEVHVETILTN